MINYKHPTRTTRPRVVSLRPGESIVLGSRIVTTPGGNRFCGFCREQERRCLCD